MPRHHDAINETESIYIPGNWAYRSPDGSSHGTGSVSPELGLQRGYGRSAFDCRRMDLSGWRDPTFLSQERYTASFPNVDGRAVYTDYHGWAIELYQSACWDMPRWPSYPDLIDDSLTDAAVTKALLKLQDQKVNLAYEFGQHKKTAKLFGEAIDTMSGLLSAFKRHNPSGLARARKGANALSSGFLQYIYGWRPEADALYGACQEIASRNRERSSFRATVVGNSPTKHWTNVWHVNALMNSPDYAIIDVRDISVTRCHVSLSYTLQSPLVESLANIGILNPAYVIWELLPWSFVIDWFLPIGNWLNSLTADFGWAFDGGTVSHKQNYQSSGSGVRTNVSGLVLGDYLIQGERMTRSVYSSSPVPLLRMKNPLNGWHGLESLALLAARFK